MQILNSIVKGISNNTESIVKSALLIIGTLSGAILNAIPQLLELITIHRFHYTRYFR